MNAFQAAQLADSDMVWLESCSHPRFRWQWWGWKRVNDTPAPMSQVRLFFMIASAPFLMQGVQFRVRKAQV